MTVEELARLEPKLDRIRYRGAAMAWTVHAREGECVLVRLPNDWLLKVGPQSCATWTALPRRPPPPTAPDPRT